VTSTNSPARARASWGRVAVAVTFIALATAMAGCMKNALPTSLTPKPCPGDPCGMMACPSGFVCQLDSQCAARCQVQPINRQF
jgi:hypothetical protein